MDLIVKNDERAVAKALSGGFNPNFHIDQMTPIISASKRQCNGIVRLLKVAVSCIMFFSARSAKSRFPRRNSEARTSMNPTERVGHPCIGPRVGW